MIVEELEVLGKPYKIYAEVLEAGAIEQFVTAMQQDCVVRGALMPDAHTGYTLPIGAVVATRDKVFPAYVGYDIGCGMCALPTTFKRGDIEANADMIFDGIYEEVPVGFNHNKEDSLWPESAALECTPVLREVFDKNGRKQLGSLGSGNHFIEVGCDESDRVWIIAHSGSRNLGHTVATHYMKLASPDGKAREDHFGLDVASDEGKGYIMDMAFCLAFALANRKELVARVEQVISRYGAGEGVWCELVNRNHNHAELRELDGELLWVHRKGATHAEAGMRGVIPGNMRDGSFIVEGLGNPEALWSSSHGAGRVMGRKEAQRKLTMEAFAEKMVSIKARVTPDTLDESPDAYKNIFQVMNQQSDLVHVVAHVVPLINCKG